MYVVDGFEFQTKEEARQAKKESDGTVSYTHLTLPTIA